MSRRCQSRCTSIGHCCTLQKHTASRSILYTILMSLHALGGFATYETFQFKEISAFLARRPEPIGRTNLDRGMMNSLACSMTFPYLRRSLGCQLELSSLLHAMDARGHLQDETKDITLRTPGAIFALKVLSPDPISIMIPMDLKLYCSNQPLM
ncbi:hypothetical protein DFS34DRAFT_420371 [Phlyctochytrium arcticum]|nr:hypothetical protein DFS34DRAFT_420371 [Phlyctochytrium arcticum]